MRPERIPVNSVIPAVLTPFDVNFEVDIPEFRRHIAEVTSVDGVTAIMVNGASGQDTTMPPEQKTKLLCEAIATSEGRTPVIGAVRESEFESDLGVLTRDAESAGVEAILVMPPGNEQDSTTDGALARFDAVFEATDLPIAFYQVSPARLGYSVETIVALAETGRIFAIKEGSGNPQTSETDMRAVRAANPEIAIWSTHSRWLLQDMAIGTDGILSGMGSISADLHVALCRAVWSSDLKEARKVSDILFRLTQVFYAPGQNPHTRMKHALKRLGRMANDVVRPPQEPLDQAEKDRIEQVLDDLRPGID